ncbi:MAG TPA: ABC transporter ATP-binding protein [Candidatus Pseudogracilibacillus intestinigallinarum]|uniref:ABC transporter ATP-binding protein n=1 Tax=Candidatus Pseudogracilibacillus intestinigallinarum TaxID=2838742 RepID=A0A9D1TJW3_9BACI|nr:ABC transporter ATP-binding protein [Candidatus Pseudogracilibacillus intestinigallinarum]
MGNMVEIENLAKTFGNEHALTNVNFDVKKGEIFGFLGPSGAGKTTTIKILTGQMSYTSGSVQVFGEDVIQLKKSKNRKRFGVLTDNSGLYDKLSIEDNLLFYCDLYDVPTNKVDEVLDVVQLREEKKKRVAKLSKGMRQRVTLARALLHEPALLFLDEPTSALDPVNTQYIYKGLRELNERGTTIFLTTHDMEEADYLCDRIAFLHDGEIKLLDTPDALKKQFAKDEIEIELKDGQHVTLSKSKKDAQTLYNYMENEEIETIHSNEPTIGDIFVYVTGRELI